MMDITMNRKDNSLYLLQSQFLRILDLDSISPSPIAMENNPTQIAVNPNTDNTYIVSRVSPADPNVVSLYTGDIFIKYIPVGYDASDIAVNPVTNKIYVSNMYDGAISIIDGGNNHEVKTVTVPSLSGKAAPSAIGVNTSTNQIFVANSNGGVSILDGASDEFVGDLIPIAGTLSGIAVNSITNRVYVTNSSDNTVSVLGTGAGTTIISGQVTDIAGMPLAGVTISAGGGMSTTTDMNGNYTFGGLISGEYTLTPLKNGLDPTEHPYAFYPPSSTISVPPNPTGVHFREILNVPLFMQGIKPYDDNFPIWEKDEFDHANTSGGFWCGTNIAGCGCSITSIAMVLSFYGVRNPADGLDTTPATVNNYFKLPPEGRTITCNKFGCLTRGYSYGDVVWTATGAYSRDAHARYGTQMITLIKGKEREGYNANTLRQYIIEGNPVILKYEKKTVDNKTITHWFVATGITGNTFTINDPLDARFRLDDPKYANKAAAMVHYVKTASDFSAIEVKVPAPAQILITDPEGKRLGFDANTSTIIQEISSGSYFFDNALSDDTDNTPPPPSEVGVYTAIITNPIPGSYSLQVVTPPNSDYGFAIYAYDHDAGLSLNAFEGQSATGQQPIYTFKYSPTPGATTIAQVISIDIKPGETPNAINVKSAGLTPVAILSTSTFDAKMVDPLSVRFGPNGASAIKYSFQDVNGDELPDLLLQFMTQKTGIKRGDTQACLTGRTTNGLNITGCEVIKT
jgi:YVTN family beta-propeller protein